MKKTAIIIILTMLAMTILAQTTLSGERKFQILVQNTSNPETVKNTNRQLDKMKAETQADDSRGLLLSLLKTGYSSMFVQKSVNASSNLLGLGVSYLVDAVKGDREKWYRKAKQQCVFRQVLANESTIDDFYALPSTQGAMDPQNLKFEGFGCRNYIELPEQPGEGREVFYVFCKLRQDEQGLRHIVNHSKFFVELDTLMFNPLLCNLPNDSVETLDTRFDFDKRKNLTFTLKVRIYASWMNEAIMIADNQQLGEFTIEAKIDKSSINSDGLFIYDKNDLDCRNMVTVSGESFIVPRSFTGTNDFQHYQPTWGTGQYRVEMEVIETCDVNDEYYQISIPSVGNARQAAFADGAPGKRKWDKMKWQTEWRTMNKRKNATPVMHNVWKSIETACKGDCWATTLTSPLATALATYEVQKLNHWLNIPTQPQQHQSIE